MADEGLTLTGETPPSEQAVETPVEPQVESKEATPPQEPPQEPHPLEPGGDRFKEVWARAKTAEADRDRWKEDAIRKDERLKTLETLGSNAVKPTEPEYGWDQLQKWVDDGKITMGQALGYREQKVAERATHEAEERLKKHAAVAQQHSFVDGELSKYLTVLPALRTPGSEDHTRAEQELAYWLQVEGVSNYRALPIEERKRLELKAMRSAFGAPDAVASARSSEREARTNREAFVETTTTGSKSSTPAKDPVKSLSAREREHYDRMIKKGRYPGGWDDVRAELNWQRKPIKA